MRRKDSMDPRVSVWRIIVTISTLLTHARLVVQLTQTILSFWRTEIEELLRLVL